MANGGQAGWRLKPSILTAFIVLVVPLFCAIVVITYLSIERSARENAREVIGRFRADAIDSIQTEFNALESLVRSAAAIGDKFPDFYRSADSAEYFQSLLLHDTRMVSVYVGMSDGLFQQARRIDPDVPIFDAPPPEGSAFAYRWIRPSSSTTSMDHYEFLDADLKPIGAAEAPTAYDPRVRLWYRSAAETGGTMVSDPDAFAALGLVGFTVAAPFHSDGALRGVAAIDLTLEGFGEHLSERSVSPNTSSYVLDRHGFVIAASDPAETYTVERAGLELKHIGSLDNALARIAYSIRPAEDSPTYEFTHEGVDYIASLTTLGDDFSKDWRIFVITPISDFTDVFEESNERLAMYGVGAIILQILLVYFMTGALSSPLERLSEKVGRIQKLGAEPSPSIESPIKEVAVLSRAVDTLDAAVRSFAAFVPVGLVKQLVSSEQELELGGHSRFLTVFFSDLQSFSTLSEELPTRELMRRVAAHFELTTRSVDTELGTIDKFIGDGVMAFWGAPALLDDHAWHACAAAMRIQRGMDTLNAAWIAQDLKPLIVRIGLHSEAVLVGNIGSESRMSYTVMGDGVNIAARLEGINKEYGSRICISHAVFKEAGERLCVRPIEDVAVKGRRSKIRIYELLGVYGSDDANLEPTEAAVRMARMSWDAYRARYAGETEEARRLYQEILNEFEGDSVASAILGRLDDA